MITLFRSIRSAIKSLLLHKLRSGLTMLGIVFGVFSVIAMLAIGEGASAQAQQQVLALGATNIIVRSVKPPESASSGSSSSRSRVLSYGLLRSDYRLLANSIPTVRMAVPIREIVQEARFLHRSMNIRLVGCTPEYLTVNHIAMSRGRFISEHDQRQLANVAVLADEAASVLFPYEDPINQAILINNESYQVIGVTQNRTPSASVGGSLSAQDFNKDIYIPLRTLESRFGDLIVRMAAGSFTAEQMELSQVTLCLDRREDVISTAQVVRESMERTHPDLSDYAVVVPLELLKQADQIRYIFNFVLGSIAAISLIVGGIGIMNIMLATVTERTREIGIRRALGARRADIIYQFLTETVVLSGTGGLMGVVLGLLTPFSFVGLKALAQRAFLTGEATDVARLFLEMTPKVPTWSLPLAFGISMLIGVVFGVYPAQRAARLDPIEALRHE